MYVEHIEGKPVSLIPKLLYTYKPKIEDNNLILYGPRIILQYMCNPTRYTIFDD